MARKEASQAEFKEATLSRKICLDKESALRIWVGARREILKIHNQKEILDKTNLGGKRHLGKDKHLCQGMQEHLV